MIRLSVPGGSLTPPQLRLIAKMASDQGRDFVDLTAFLTLQLHGIPADQETAVLQSLEAVGLSGDLKETPPVSAETQEFRDSVGVYEQDQPDLFFIGIPVLAARLDSTQVGKIADLAERYGDGFVQLTLGQNLLLRGIGKDRVAQVMEGLEAVGLKVKASALARSIRPCPAGGEDFQLAQKIRELIESLERRVLLDEAVRVNVGRCAEACLHCAAAPIRLQVGRMEWNGQTVETVEVSLNGRRVGAVFPFSEAPDRLERLLVVFKKSRNPGESFRAYCARIGEQTVAISLTDPVQEESSA